MQSQLHQHDSEQHWYTYDSSAGLPTQPLGAARPTRAPRAYGSTWKNVAGLALVVLGLLLPLASRVPDRALLNAGMILLTLASGFLFLALWRRIYLLLLPGCLLASLSAGLPLVERTSGVSVVWGLVLGLLSIFFLGRLVFHVQHRWPLLPAVPLFVAGFIVALVKLPLFFASTLMALPLVLIGAGLYLGARRTAA